MSNKKQFKNGTAIQQDRKSGKFITTPKSLLLDKNLTDKAKVLFQLMVDTPSDSKLSLEYYRKALDWAKGTMTDTFENLRVNGYARYEKHPKGKDNGYKYSYVLSEYGNLKVEEEKTPIQEEEPSTPEAVEPATESNPYASMTPEQLDAAIAKLKKTREAEVKIVIEEKMNGGTVAQRKETTVKVLKYWSDKFDQGKSIEDDEIRSRVFTTHHQTKTANRVIDPRYND